MGIARAPPSWFMVRGSWVVTGPGRGSRWGARLRIDLVLMALWDLPVFGVQVSGAQVFGCSGNSLSVAFHLLNVPKNRFYKKFPQFFSEPCSKGGRLVQQGIKRGHMR